MRGAFFLPPSDVYIRSFLYLLYTLIKLYYTKALSDQALSLALDWILFLWRPRILVSFVVHQQPFNSLIALEAEVPHQGGLGLVEHVLRATLSAFSPSSAFSTRPRLH